MAHLQDSPFAGRGTSGPLAELDVPPPRKRKKQEEEEEHGELNLTAMIDMMTILLVFLLKSYSVSTTNINTADVKLPKATTPEAIVEATKITLTKNGILVDEKPVPLPGGGKLGLAQTADGSVFGAESLDPAGNDHLVPALKARLEEVAQKQRRILEKQRRELHSPLLIIADAKVPFRTVSQVVYTAGQVTIDVPGADGKTEKDGWFDEYRFVVVRREP